MSGRFLDAMLRPAVPFGFSKDRSLIYWETWRTSGWVVSSLMGLPFHLAVIETIDAVASVGLFDNQQPPNIFGGTKKDN